MSDEELNSIIENAEMHLEQLKEHNHDLYEENKTLKEDFKRHIDRINELTNRIDKAIEYIKQYGNLYCLKHKQFKDYKQYEVLLNILKGE